MKRLYFIIVIIAVLCLPYCSKKEMPMREEIDQGWKFRQVGKEEWYKAVVPGCVHADLLGNKLIEEPYYGTNEKDLQWIDKEEWEYRTFIEFEKEMFDFDHLEMVFHGLDTYADVYINDSHVLSSDNMFRTWRLECKSLFKPGQNELRIKFRSPVKVGLEKLSQNTFKGKPYSLPAGNDHSQIGGLGDKKVSVFTRKAPYHYGWDWGPRFVTSGIWKPVELVAWNKIKIRDVFIQQEKVDKEEALLTALVEIEATGSHKTEISVTVNGDTAVEKEIGLSPGLNKIPLAFKIGNPQLWWPHNLGKPHLYDISVKAVTGKITDEQSQKHGIRTVRLVQKPDRDGKGKSFYFEINGVPVFAKGANMIPGDLFLHQVIPGKYASFVYNAFMANMNMLRVWGGGIYEKDLFYDLCDRYGIMIWQDFMFACSLYPGNDEFVESVRLEAVDNVKRLRKHPCIVLWCGNNEIHTAWHNWGYKKNYEKQDPELAQKIKADYDRVFHDVLPKAVAEHHAEIPYWPSSPMAAWEPGKNIEDVSKAGQTSGDEHYWGVWHGEEPFENYKTRIPRFMSEYGFQSFPAWKTIEMFAEPSQRHIESEVMLSHQKHPRGNQLIKKYMADHYRMPGDFEHFVYISQLLQAEGMKTAIEAHRLNMPYCMGSLYWQFNDCWPVASWSSFDYFLLWKASHFFIRKAFAPTIVAFSQDEKHLDVNVVSDNPKGFNGQLILDFTDFEGNRLWSHTMPVSVKFNQSLRVYRFDKTQLLGKRNRNSVCVVARLGEKPGTLFIEKARNIHYFAPVKDLELGEVKIKMEIDKLPFHDGYRILFISNKLAKNCYFRLGEPGEGFTDNFIDIPPGIPTYIDVLSKEPEEVLRKKITITTVKDTYGEEEKKIEEK